jgi:hypothetical protein
MESLPRCSQSLASDASKEASAKGLEKAQDGSGVALS